MSTWVRECLRKQAEIMKLINQKGEVEQDSNKKNVKNNQDNKSA